jgi:hypothetical protein
MFKNTDELIAALQAIPPEQRQLPPFITNGDLPWTGIVSVSVQPADYGQLVLISNTVDPINPVVAS